MKPSGHGSSSAGSRISRLAEPSFLAVILAAVPNGRNMLYVPCPAGSRLYVKDGVALYMLGMGKVNAALSTRAVLSDERFDFSQACIISTGCAGSAAGYGV